MPSGLANPVFSLGFKKKKEEKKLDYVLSYKYYSSIFTGGLK
jgi:hypothetical protein